MLAIAEAMSANKRWPNLAQYSILKETLADLRTIASGQDLEGAESSAVLVEQFETFEELEEELEKHVDEASENKDEKVAESGGGVHPTPVADQPNVGEESQVGKLLCHLGHQLNPPLQEVKADRVDPQVVEQLHHAYRLEGTRCVHSHYFNFDDIRLGGHGAAAFALWWLEEGSNKWHFDQAGVTFQVLPSYFTRF